jgi:hypothetical protein
LPEAARTWLIAPDGTPTFLLGVNTVMRDTRAEGRARCAGIGAYIRRADPSTAAHVEWARLATGESAGHTVPRPYHFNSVGAFSHLNDFDDSGGDSYMIRPPERGGAGAPYCVVLDPAPRGDDRALRDESGTVLRSGFGERPVGDPFNPAFHRDLDALVEREVGPRAGDPGLQLWFAGNETGIFDVAGRGGGVRDLRRWVWSDVPAGSSIDAPTCSRHGLAAFLRDRYDGSIDALNAAWEAAYRDFVDVVESPRRPVPYVHDANLRAREDLQRFVHDELLPRWIGAVTTRIRAADPNHLVATPRLAIASPAAYRFWSGRGEAEPDHWAEAPRALVGAGTADVRYRPFDLLARTGDAGFDLVAINGYTGQPRFPAGWFEEGVRRIRVEAGLPVLVSEFGLRARIDGWSNRGGAQAFVPHTDSFDDQRQRGTRYRSQLEQFIAAGILGACWHAWSDRFIAADRSLQINLGLVRCSDPPRGMAPGDRWPRLDNEVAETNRTIYERIASLTGW